MTTKNLAPFTLAVALTLSAGVALMPGGAAAQGNHERAGRGDQEIERHGRLLFERGYRQGRMDERERIMRSDRGDAGPAGMSQGQGGFQDRDGDGRDAVLLLDPHGHALLLVERGRQEQATLQAMQSMQEAREAVQQGDRQRAEQALGRAERVLQQASAAAQPQQRRQEIVQRLGEAERALQRDDVQTARQALQQAREALRSAGQGGGQQAGTGGPRPPQDSPAAATSGPGPAAQPGTTGGPNPQAASPGGGPTRGTTAGTARAQ